MHPSFLKYISRLLNSREYSAYSNAEYLSVSLRVLHTRNNYNKNREDIIILLLYNSLFGCSNLLTVQSVKSVSGINIALKTISESALTLDAVNMHRAYSLSE